MTQHTHIIIEVTFNLNSIIIIQVKHTCMHTNMQGMTQDLVQVLDPVLMSCVTLNAIVRDNEMGYHDVVHLLEWLHFRFPDILEERKYIQLLVELKTKVC